MIVKGKTLRRVIAFLVALVICFSLLSAALPTGLAADTKVMTAEQFVNCLQKALSRKTTYNNKYPYNLGYYNGSTISWDCWNLGKSIIWSKGTIVDNYKKGTFAKPNTSCGLGDWDGLTIIKKAPNCNSNFTKLVAGEWLYMSGHTGYYVGNGNVIECTTAWGANGVTMSKIDSKGNRTRNGSSGGKWLYHGMVPWIDYSTASGSAYLNKCTAYPSYLTVQITQSTTVKSLPCSAGTDSNSKDVVTLSAGATFNVTAIYKNSANNYWYKGTTSAGKSGYVFSGHTSVKAFRYDDVAIANVSKPSSLYVGDKYSIKGDISSKINKIYSVNGYIYPNGVTAGSNYLFGKTDTINSRGYSLLNSAVDLALKFNELSAGTYCYVVTANVKNYYCTDGKTLKNQSKDVGLVTSSFTVKNKYYLDVNGLLDGANAGNTSGYGTFDVYINGVQKANDATDYYVQWPAGTKYEIKDIKATGSHVYNGVAEGSLSGTMGSSKVNIRLSFSTASGIPASIIVDSKDVTLNLASNPSTTVKITAVGNLPVNYSFRFDLSGYDTLLKGAWGEWEESSNGRSCPLMISAAGNACGSAKIAVYLIDTAKNNAILDTLYLNVRVTDAGGNDGFYDIPTELEIPANSSKSVLIGCTADLTQGNKIELISGNPNVVSGQWAGPESDGKQKLILQTGTEGEAVVTVRIVDANGAVLASRDIAVKSCKNSGTPGKSDSSLPCDGGKTCPGKMFKDMPAKGNWAHDAIDWAVDKGVTNGTDKTHFSPLAGCTRGHVVTFLWRSVGCPEPTGKNSPFRDVKKGAFYYKAVLWAVENGVTKGTSATTFSPNATCTRGQIVTFLYRFKGSSRSVTAQSSFKDVSKTAFYYPAMLWAVECGITNGTSKTTFAPGATCTRGQVVTFLYRASQQSNSGAFDKKNYEIVISDDAWDQALAEAKKKGGKLVSFESRDEYRFVLDLIEEKGKVDGVYYSLGGRRDETGKSYFWVDRKNNFIGKQLNEKSAWCADCWELGEPSYVYKDRQETVVMMYYSAAEARWAWYDGSGTYRNPKRTYGYIIEYGG